MSKKPIHELTDEEISKMLEGIASQEETLKEERPMSSKKKNTGILPPPEKNLSNKPAKYFPDLVEDVNELNYSPEEELDIVEKPHQGKKIGYRKNGAMISKNYNTVDPRLPMPKVAVMYTQEEVDIIRFLRDSNVVPGMDASVSIKGLWQLYKKRSFDESNAIANPITSKWFKSIVIKYYPLHFTAMARHKKFADSKKIKKKLTRRELNGARLGIKIVPNMRYTPEEINDAFYYGWSPEAIERCRAGYQKMKERAVEQRKIMFAIRTKAVKEKRMKDLCDYIRKMGIYEEKESDS